MFKNRESYVYLFWLLVGVFFVAAVLSCVLIFTTFAKYKNS